MTILRLFEYADLTDEQAVELTGLFGGWKRCSDLRRLGFIKDTGDRRTTQAGAKAMVCAITPAGIEALK
jgi:hypothetical protein